jgi:hypothetical protein
MDQSSDVREIFFNGISDNLHVNSSPCSIAPTHSDFAQQGASSKSWFGTEAHLEETRSLLDPNKCSCARSTKA